MPLMRWTNAIYKLYNCRLSSTEDIAKTVSDCLSENAANLDPSLFEEFAAAWNRFHAVSSVVNFDQDIIEDCQKLVIEKMDSSRSILLSCVRVKRLGREVPFMAHVLGKIQNDFLRTCYQACPALLNAASDKNDASLTNIDDSLKALPVVLLQQVSEEDLIQCEQKEMHRLFEANARPSLDYGTGNRLDINWDQVESTLRQRLIVNKPFMRIDLLNEGSFKEFKFRHEIMLNQSSLFTRLEEIVPQQSYFGQAGSFDIDQLLHDRYLTDLLHLESRIFPAVENILYAVLQHRKKTVLLNRKIIDFVTDYMDASTVELFRLYSRTQSILAHLTLQHLQILYEFMEDMISDTVIGCIAEQYKQPIKADLLKEIVGYFAEKVGNVRCLESSLRRFVIRNLRRVEIGVESMIPPELKMVEVMELVPWPKGVDMEMLYEKDTRVKRVFDEMLVGQCMAVLIELQETINRLSNPTTDDRGSLERSANPKEVAATMSTAEYKEGVTKKPRRARAKIEYSAI